MLNLKDAETITPLQARRQYVQQMREVIAELGYSGKRGESWELVHALNRRGLWYPDFRRTRFEESMEYARPWETPNELRSFLKNHARDLWEATATARRVRRSWNGMHRAQPPVSNSPLATVSNAGEVEEAGDSFDAIAGWTVRKDHKGYFRAYRRIDGKVRSVYLGRSLDGAEAKIRAHEAKLDAQEY